jgi:hypothetical protein
VNIPGFDEFGCDVCRASWLREYKIQSLKGLSGKYQCYVYQCDVCHNWWRETDRWIIAIDEKEAAVLLETNTLKWL